MIQKLTLTTVIRKSMVSSRTNKSYTSLSIKTKEHGDRYLSGFGSAKTDSWKEGEIVTLEVTESEKLDKNGKPYLNWDHVDNEKLMEEKISYLQEEIKKITLGLTQLAVRIVKLETQGLTSAGTPVPTFVPNTPEQEADYVRKMDDYEKANGDLNVIAEEEYHR